jgi:hypothetical protein
MATHNAVCTKFEPSPNRIAKLEACLLFRHHAIHQIFRGLHSQTEQLVNMSLCCRSNKHQNGGLEDPEALSLQKQKRARKSTLRSGTILAGSMSASFPRHSATTLRTPSSSLSQWENSSRRILSTSADCRSTWRPTWTGCRAIT